MKKQWTIKWALKQLVPASYRFVGFIRGSEGPVLASCQWRQWFGVPYKIEWHTFR